MSRRLAPIAALVLLVLSPSTALACKCVASSFEAARESAAAIFEGIVTGVAPEGERRTRVTLRVVRTWKGDDDAEQIEVRTASSSAACGVPFLEGQGYLVFAQAGDEGLSVSLCGRTRRSEEAGDDLAALGVGITPVQVEDEGEPDEMAGAPAGSEVHGGGFAHCSASSLPGRGLPPVWLTALGALMVWARVHARRRRT